MFPRGPLLSLLLSSILYYHCYAETTEKGCSTMQKATMDESVLLSTIMVCTMFSILILLVPTVLYYRYCSKEEDIE